MADNIVTSVPSKHHMIQYMADNKASMHRYSTHISSANLEVDCRG